MKHSLIFVMGVAVLLPVAASLAGGVRIDGSGDYSGSLVTAVKDDKPRNKQEKKQAKKEKKREKENSSPGGSHPQQLPVETGPVQTAPTNDNILWGDYQHVPPKQ
jgi:hypothetical protein